MSSKVEHYQISILLSIVYLGGPDVSLGIRKHTGPYQVMEMNNNESKLHHFTAFKSFLSWKINFMNCIFFLMHYIETHNHHLAFT